MQLDITITPQMRQQFTADLNTALADRLNAGQKKYGGIYKRNPLADAWEELLDALFYIWLARAAIGDTAAANGFAAADQVPLSMAGATVKPRNPQTLVVYDRFAEQVKALPTEIQTGIVTAPEDDSNGTDVIVIFNTQRPLDRLLWAHYDPDAFEVVAAPQPLNTWDFGVERKP